MKIVYLDQNQWIKFGRIKNGKMKSQNLIQLYKSLKQKIKSKEIVMPLSIIHLDELLTSTYNFQRKQELAEIMIEFSKGFTIPPYTSLLNWEIDLAILKRIKEHYNQSKGDKIAKEITQLESIPFITGEYSFLGRGIPHMLGSTLSAFNKTTGKPVVNMQIKSVENWLKGADFFLVIISNIEITEKANEMKKNFLEIIMQSEIDLKVLQGIDKSKRDNAMKGYFFIKSGIIRTITKKLVFWAEKLKIDINKAVTLPFYHYNDTEKSPAAINDFINLIPILNTFLSLKVHLYKQFNRKITVNDFFDISFLCVAIPYGDIVICDRFFANAARQLHLGSTYNTKISHQVEELSNI